VDLRNKGLRLGDANFGKEEIDVLTKKKTWGTIVLMHFTQVYNGEKKLKKEKSNQTEYRLFREIEEDNLKKIQLYLFRKLVLSVVLHCYPVTFTTRSVIKNKTTNVTTRNLEKLNIDFQSKLKSFSFPRPPTPSRVKPWERGWRVTIHKNVCVIG